MARTKSLESMNADLELFTAELEKLDKKRELLIAKITKVQKQKQEYESKQIMDAYRKSGKSLQELLTFLDV